MFGGVKCDLSIGKIKARLGKSYFEGVNIVSPKEYKGSKELSEKNIYVCISTH